MLKILKWIAIAFAVLIGGVLVSMLAANHRDVEKWTFEIPKPRDAAADDGVLIFGATRNTGLDVAEILSKRGDKVTAVVRSGSDSSGLKALGVTIVAGDAMDMESVRAAFAGKNYRAVLTTIACFSCNPKPDYLGNKNIFDAAKEAGAKRVVLVTTIGAGNSYDSAPWSARSFLKDMLPLKTQAEDHLKSLGLDYTIIRPGGLTFTPATGEGWLSEDPAAFGVIGREELARLVVGVLDDDRTAGKTFSAFDDSLLFPLAFF
jgi:uncharacterized protein YbjT (DUF2867 family)